MIHQISRHVISMHGLCLKFITLSCQLTFCQPSFPASVPIPPEKQKTPWNLWLCSTYTWPKRGTYQRGLLPKYTFRLIHADGFLASYRVDSFCSASSRLLGYNNIWFCSLGPLSCRFRKKQNTHRIQQQKITPFNVKVAKIQQRTWSDGFTPASKELPLTSTYHIAFF